MGGTLRAADTDRRPAFPARPVGDSTIRRRAGTCPGPRRVAVSGPSGAQLAVVAKTRTAVRLARIFVPGAVVIETGGGRTSRRDCAGWVRQFGRRSLGGRRFHGPGRQAAVDTWVAGYNCDRPHQALNMGYPADRFAPSQAGPRPRRGVVAVAGTRPAPHGQPRRTEHVSSTWLPNPPSRRTPVAPREDADAAPLPMTYRGGPVEFERVVPASGNLGVC